VRRVLKIASIVLIVVVVASGALFFVARAVFSHIVVADPGPTGRRVHTEGVFANYFPAKSRRPGIVLLGGSEGGIGSVTNEAAKLLQAQGYSVLTPSYFGAPGQHKTLELIPLETFDRAIAWLRAQPEVDANRIGIAGVSKGAEAALLVATRHPELRAVFAGVPSSVVWPGIHFPSLKTPSSWTLGGRPLPYVPYGPFRFGMVLGKLDSAYRDGLKHVAAHPDAAIPIEEIKAPVLLVCGKADRLWPSCPMSRQLEARAKAHGGPSVTLLAYNGAGHLCVGPPQRKPDPFFATYLLGGTAKANEAARADGWPKILAFIRAAVG